MTFWATAFAFLTGLLLGAIGMFAALLGFGWLGH
jgi:hypothetical protein